jgi:toxin ParE1/3/4
MLLVKWRPAAQQDLLEILAFIAEHNEAAALDMLARIEQSVEQLPQHPFLYRPSQRLPGCRELVVHPNYVVYYEVSDLITVLAVVHARQLFPG